jgi:hypothetical protein
VLREQVSVERRGDAERVVVSELQLWFRFHEIDAEQESIAGNERRADAAHQIESVGRIEVADVGAEKEHERPAIGRGTGRVAQASAVLGRVRDDAYVFEAVERLRRGFERPARDIHEMQIERGALSCASFEQALQLVAVPRPEFHDRGERLEVAHDLRAVGGQQRGLRARDPVPRQVADRVEQRGPERIVEVPRRQLSRMPREVQPDVAGKGADRRFFRHA